MSVMREFGWWPVEISVFGQVSIAYRVFTVVVSLKNTAALLIPLFFYSDAFFPPRPALRFPFESRPRIGCSNQSLNVLYPEMLRRWLCAKPSTLLIDLFGLRSLLSVYRSPDTRQRIVPLPI